MRAFLCGCLIKKSFYAGSGPQIGDQNMPFMDVFLTPPKP